MLPQHDNTFKHVKFQKQYTFKHVIYPKNCIFWLIFVLCECVGQRARFGLMFAVKVFDRKFRSFAFDSLSHNRMGSALRCSERDESRLQLSHTPLMHWIEFSGSICQNTAGMPLDWRRAWHDVQKRNQ